MNILVPSKKLILPSNFSKERDKIWTPEKELLFRIKKYSDIFVNPFNVKVSLNGWFRLQIMGADGRKRWATDWFSNNITNYGLDLLGTSTYKYGYCQVGTGNNPPANTDTSLQTYLASSALTANPATTNGVSPDYSSNILLTYKFATGGVIGNISEIGIGPSASSGSSLFSRELIRDASGNPTTISLGSSDTLIVYYNLKVYPPVTDSAVLVNGTIGGSAVTRTVTTRSAQINSSAWLAGTGQYAISFASLPNGGGSTAVLSTSAIAAITSAPPTSVLNSSGSRGSYTSGSYKSTIQWIWIPSAGSGNYLSTWFYLGTMLNGGSNNSGAASFQFGFDTALVKTNVQTLTIQSSVTWARR